jgi:hypothetical protein
MSELNVACQAAVKERKKAQEIFERQAMRFAKNPSTTNKNQLESAASGLFIAQTVINEITDKMLGES